MAASLELPDFDDLLVVLAQLGRRGWDVSTLRGKLYDRLTGFPNEVAERHERRLSLERRLLHRRIDLLHAQLAPVRHQLDRD